MYNIILLLISRKIHRGVVFVEPSLRLHSRFSGEKGKGPIALSRLRRDYAQIPERKVAPKERSPFPGGGEGSLRLRITPSRTYLPFRAEESAGGRLPGEKGSPGEVATRTAEGGGACRPSTTGSRGLSRREACASTRSGDAALSSGDTSLGRRGERRRARGRKICPDKS